MARGWESKSVEAQQADREAVNPKGTGVQPTPEEAARADRRHLLELSRARAVSDRATAMSPAHRAMLDAAIRALEDQLK